MRELPKAGERYRHFKGTVYEVLAVARHTETMEELVVYRDSGNPDAVYARPMIMFMSETDRNKYPDCTADYRFTRIDAEEGKEEEPPRTASCGVDYSSDSAVLCSVERKPQNANEEKPEPESGIPEGVSADLIRFLDEDDYEEKIRILDEIKARVDDGMAGAMGASLDLALNDGPVEAKIAEIRNYLLLQVKYDGRHLRERYYK